jgi:ATP-binding cassette subfamily B protein
VLRALAAEARRGRTVLFVTHRLAALRNADRILVLEGGCLAEAGTYPQLLRRRGAFWELARRARRHPVSPEGAADPAREVFT